MIPIRDSAQGATFSIRVQPRARKNAVIGVLGDALKIWLTAPPLEGRANEACADFLAQWLSLPRSSVTITAGHSSRNKVVCVAGISATALSRRLDAMLQRREP